MSKKMFTGRTLPMALAAVLAISPMQVMAAGNDLAGHWAEKTITKWQDAGLIKGYADGTFKPNNSVTRAEFVVMMNNALGFEDAEDIAFGDVKEGDWYYNAVAKAVAVGYSKGYADGTFKPGATITRAEAAVMIANAAGLEANAAGAEEFTDAAAIPAWAKDSISAVVEAGFMSGYPDGSFGAAKSITRAEAVSSLNRVMGGFEAETEEIEETPAETPAAEDMTVTEDDTVIEDGVITGNLIIDEAVGEGEVYLNDVVVEGDVIVNGGGDDSVYFKNVTVKGKVKVNKKGVRVQFIGDTRVPHVEVNKVANITSENFEGEVGTITIVGDLGTGTRVNIDVPAEAVVIEGKSSVAINADVVTVEVGKDAEGAKVEIAKNAAVETFAADAKVNITGTGKVENLEANADGITVNKNLSVDKTETASGVSKPITSGGSTGGGGGSSSSGSNKPSSPSVTVKDVTAKADETAFEIQANKDAYERMDIKLEGAKLKEDAALTVTPAQLSGLVLTAANAEEGVLADGWQASVTMTGTPTATTDGPVSCTVTIPKDALILESGHQATKDITVSFTVEVVAPKYEVTKVTIAEQDIVNMEQAAISLSEDKNLTTEAAALAYLKETYKTVTLTGNNTVEDKTAEAQITGWKYDSTEAYPADAVKAATTEAPVTLYFTADYVMPENFEDNYNPITAAVKLQITAAQTEKETEAETYALTCNDKYATATFTVNGEEVTEAAAGDDVTVTVDKKYIVGLTVMGASGTEITTVRGEGPYTFTMPSEAVTVIPLREFGVDNHPGGIDLRVNCNEEDSMVIFLYGVEAVDLNAVTLTAQDKDDSLASYFVEPTAEFDEFGYLGLRIGADITGITLPEDGSGISETYTLTIPVTAITPKVGYVAPEEALTVENLEVVVMPDYIYITEIVFTMEEPVFGEKLPTWIEDSEDESEIDCLKYTIQNEER